MTADYAEVRIQCRLSSQKAPFELSNGAFPSSVPAWLKLICLPQEIFAKLLQFLLL